MARPPSKQPTDRELEILEVLWDSGPCGLGDVWQGLQRRRPVAKTTVATMLNMMRQKGLVKRANGARGYQWSAGLSRQATTRGSLGRLLDRFFDGSAGKLVAHLLADETLTDQDRQELRRMLDDADGPGDRGAAP